ncbi:MAG: hypothetical protein EB117_16415 [Betaproteobacteria bacterium]|nr:hypothetical protein [Betaproteobacteria bacterium]
MPVTLTNIGIQSVEYSLAQSVERTTRTESASVMNYLGGFGHAEAYDPVTEFSISGRGDLPAGLAVGIAGDGIDGLFAAGTTIVTSVSLTENNTDFNSWDISGTNYPATDDEKQRQIVTFAWMQSRPLQQVLLAVRSGCYEDEVSEFEFGLAVSDLPDLMVEIQRLAEINL